MKLVCKGFTDKGPARAANILPVKATHNRLPERAENCAKPAHVQKKRKLPAADQMQVCMQANPSHNPSPGPAGRRKCVVGLSEYVLAQHTVCNQRTKSTSPYSAAILRQQGSKVTPASAINRMHFIEARGTCFI